MIIKGVSLDVIDLHLGAVRQAVRGGAGDAADSKVDEHVHRPVHIGWRIGMGDGNIVEIPDDLILVPEHAVIMEAVRAWHLHRD